jgi:hypothetical protein
LPRLTPPPRRLAKRPRAIEDGAATVTPLRPDRTNAERQRRFRQKRKAAKAVTAARNGTAITTIEICSLAARVRDGEATPQELQLTDQLLMRLVRMLPRDSEVFLED